MRFMLIRFDKLPPSTSEVSRHTVKPDSCDGIAGVELIELGRRGHTNAQCPYLHSDSM